MIRDDGDRRRISIWEGGEGGVSVWSYLLFFFFFADETKCPVCQGTVIAEGLC